MDDHRQQIAGGIGGEPFLPQLVESPRHLEQQADPFLRAVGDHVE